MTYCLGLMTRQGLVLASDSRTNAGYDQVNICRKMHTFVQSGERVFVILSSGSLSLAQSIVTLLRQDFDDGKGLASADSMYDAARLCGEKIRHIARIDRKALERDGFKFNVNLLLGGQVRGEVPGLYLVYPQGNPLRATEDSPFLQIGETKYGRPILDRGIRYERTSLPEAVKYALISMDSTVRSNVTVGPPIDLAVYDADSFALDKVRRFQATDPEWQEIHSRWENALRNAITELPGVSFDRK